MLTLITQFGGGKTHTLTALYHLARAGVFVGNAWDPAPGRETPWIDLARQLAGDHGVAALGPAARTTPPGTEALARVFAAAQAPVLLLFDEVLNFVNRHRGLAERRPGLPARHTCYHTPSFPGIRARRRWRSRTCGSRGSRPPRSTAI